MDFILDFFHVVNTSIVSFAENLPNGCVGKEVNFIKEEDFKTIESKSIVVFGVPEDRTAVNNAGTGKNLDEFRKSFYALYQGNWKNKIYDFGDLKVGETFNDTLVILQEIVTNLLKKDLIPVIIGGSQALTYALYRSFDQLEQRVNLALVDSRFDLGILENPLDSKSFLTNIIMERPYNLDNCTHLGYQTFYNSQEEIQLMENLLFDINRLGILKKEIELTEPLLRNADLLSLDFGAIRAADAVANQNKSISGFTSDEICQICRYAGISDRLNVFGIFEYNPSWDHHNQSAQLVAQMIWYFIEGVNLRKPEFPNLDLEHFKKYIVIIDDETFNFYKSEVSNRWWMEISLKNDNKIKRRTLIPCAYNDYLTANRLEIPERWYLNRKKLE